MSGSRAANVRTTSCEVVLRSPILRVSARMHKHSYRPSRSPNRKRLLGAVLFGTWHPTRWSNAKRSEYRSRGHVVQHVLLRDYRREACAESGKVI